MFSGPWPSPRAMLLADSRHFNLLVVLGPTASGKTRLAVQLAARLGGEIISADSRQVYRGMDLGTGKDLAEYGSIPYHLIDTVDPGYEFNVFKFQRHFGQAFQDITRRGRLALLAGGTGLYLEAALRGYYLPEVPVNQTLRSELANASPADLAERLRRCSTPLHNTTDLLDRQRLIRAIEIAEFQTDRPPEPLPPITPIICGIRWDRQLLRQRITDRLRARLEQGLLTEVENLVSTGTSWETLEFYGLEYRFVARHLKGELTRNDMFQKLNSAIHDFAKRQETWFRRMERNGTVIHWLNGADSPLAEALNLLGMA
jgi:tRNA dimethylallyltransferase